MAHVRAAEPVSARLGSQQVPNYLRRVRAPVAIQSDTGHGHVRLLYGVPRHHQHAPELGVCTKRLHRLLSPGPPGPLVPVDRPLRAYRRCLFSGVFVVDHGDSKHKRSAHLTPHMQVVHPTRVGTTGTSAIWYRTTKYREGQGEFRLAEHSTH